MTDPSLPPSPADCSQPQRSLIADLCHDLQSPLTGLRTELEVALAKPEAVDVALLARRLLFAGAEMEMLVGEMLTWAIDEEAGGLQAPELLDLGALVSEEAGRVRHGSSIVLDTTEITGIHVRGNALELRRLTRNLLENALRHAQAHVWVRLGPAEDGCALDVIDDGPGVAPDDREHIFERYYRAADAGGTAVEPGSGLGLAISRQIARRHGGDVSLVTGNEGGHFRVTLPIAD